MILAATAVSTGCRREDAHELAALAGAGADRRRRCTWLAETGAGRTGRTQAFFLPERGSSTREAKRICVGCHDKVECLGYTQPIEEARHWRLAEDKLDPHAHFTLTRPTHRHPKESTERACRPEPAPWRGATRLIKSAPDISIRQRRVVSRVHAEPQPPRASVTVIGSADAPIPGVSQAVADVSDGRGGPRQPSPPPLVISERALVNWLFTYS